MHEFSDFSKSPRKSARKIAELWLFENSKNHVFAYCGLHGSPILSKVAPKIAACMVLNTPRKKTANINSLLEKINDFLILTIFLHMGKISFCAQASWAYFPSDLDQI